MPDHLIDYLGLLIIGLIAGSALSSWMDKKQVVSWKRIFLTAVACILYTILWLFLRKYFLIFGE